MSKRSPFDYVKSVWNTKEYLKDNVELFRKEYTPFIVNRALSNSEIGVLFANEMNNGFVDSDIQYDFYYHGIPKQRSFLKWAKKDKNTNQDDINMIQELYGVNTERAIEYLNVINIEDLTNLRSLQGGK